MGDETLIFAQLYEKGSDSMAWSKPYTAWDNSDREDFYDDYGNLQTTHVDRYDILTGQYTHTDVYNQYDQKIDSFKK